ncbi:VOC family protein, partial [Lentilactobacillus hilgardii]|nr:VOC family protein [Lentilactobacillus hilgardii]
MIKDDITGIQHVGIPSKDLDKTIAFYESLGFDQAGL